MARSDLSDFCEFLYGDGEGYVHAPVKNASTGKFEEFHYFLWPLQREELLHHVSVYSNSHEVYLTPALFKTASNTVQDFHGSNVVWADFDGNPPSLEDLKAANVPEPTLVVQSSVVGREHWYWRYEKFTTEILEVQSVNRALTYTLQGDLGVWQVNHSLRPVDSINHKRGGVPVKIKQVRESHVYQAAHFEALEMPEASYTIDQYKSEVVPNPLQTLMKYGPWTPDAIDLLTKKTIPEGSRARALARTALTCCEHGLSNIEVFAMLQSIDKSWKKFSERHNPEKYYVDLVNYARQKIPYEPIEGIQILSEGLALHNVVELSELSDDTEWLMDRVCPVGGVLYFVGQSGVGKTSMASNFGMALALGRKCLDWEPTIQRERKVLHLSLDMPTHDATPFFNDMLPRFSPRDHEILKSNYLVYSQAEKIKFFQPESILVKKLLRTLENYNPDVMIIDSAGFALAGNLNNQEEVSKSIEFLDIIRMKYNVTLIFIHHLRKDPPGHGYKAADLDDMFGSAYIAASASGIIAMKKSKEDEKIINMTYVKARYRGDNTGFSVMMRSNREFVRPTFGALSAPTPQTSPVATSVIDSPTKKTRGNKFFDV